MKQPFESSHKVALTETLAELQRQQDACAQLRLEQRLTVPIQDVQDWCATVSDQLRVVCDALEGKVDQWRQKMAEKNMVIRRLHEKLKSNAAQRVDSKTSSNADGMHTPRTPQPRVPPYTGPGGVPRSPSGQDVMVRNKSGEMSPRSLRVADSSPVVSARSLRMAYSAEDRKVAEMSQDTREDTDPIDPNDNSGELDALDEAALATPASQAEMTPSRGLAGYGASSIRVEDRGGFRSARRANNPGATQGNTSQRNLRRDGPVGELKLQNTNFRREVANLRRQNAELVNQLRARDGQIDQLTGTLRELQIVTQRQMELYKRQLSMKDDSLQAMQEELIARTTHPVVATHSVPGYGGEALRSRRRVSDPQAQDMRVGPSRPAPRTEASHRIALSPRGKVSTQHSTPTLGGNAPGMCLPVRRTANSSVGPQSSGSRRSTSVDETSNRVRSSKREHSASQGRVSQRKGPPSPAEELLGTAKEVVSARSMHSTSNSALYGTRKGRICWDPGSGPSPTKKAANP